MCQSAGWRCPEGPGVTGTPTLPHAPALANADTAEHESARLFPRDPTTGPRRDSSQTRRDPTPGRDQALDAVEWHTPHLATVVLSQVEVTVK